MLHKNADYGAERGAFQSSCHDASQIKALICIVERILKKCRIEW